MKFTTRNLPGLAEVVATIIGGPVLGEMTKCLVRNGTIVSMGADHEQEVCFRKGVWSNIHGNWKFKDTTSTLYADPIDDSADGYTCELLFPDGPVPDTKAMYDAVKAFILADPTSTGPVRWRGEYESECESECEKDQTDEPDTSRESD